MTIERASDNPFPSILFVEGDPEALADDPASGQRRLAVGTDHLLYLVDPSGVKTQVGGAAGGMATDTLWNAAGDLAYGTGSDTASRLGIGTANQVLRVNSGATAPEWATPSGGALAVGTYRFPTTDYTTTSTTFVDLTGASITMTTGAHRVLLMSMLYCYNSHPNSQQFTYTVDGTEVSGRANGLMNYSLGQSGSNISSLAMNFLTDVLSAGSHTFKIQWKTGGNTATFYNNASLLMNTFSALEQSA